MQIITCNRGLLKQSLKDALKANAGTFEQVRHLLEPSEHHTLPVSPVWSRALHCNA